MSGLIDSRLAAQLNAAQWLRRHGLERVSVVGITEDGGVDIVCDRALAQVTTSAHGQLDQLQALVGDDRQGRDARRFAFSRFGYTQAAQDYAEATHLYLFAFRVDGHIVPVNALARSFVRDATASPGALRYLLPTVLAILLATLGGFLWLREETILRVSGLLVWTVAAAVPMYVVRRASRPELASGFFFAVASVAAALTGIQLWAVQLPLVRAGALVAYGLAVGLAALVPTVLVVGASARRTEARRGTARGLGSTRGAGSAQDADVPAPAGPISLPDPTSPDSPEGTASPVIPAPRTRSARPSTPRADGRLG